MRSPPARYSVTKTELSGDSQRPTSCTTKADWIRDRSTSASRRTLDFSCSKFSFTSVKLDKESPGEGIWLLRHLPSPCLAQNKRFQMFQNPLAPHSRISPCTPTFPHINLELLYVQMCQIPKGEQWEEHLKVFWLSEARFDNGHSGGGLGHHLCQHLHVYKQKLLLTSRNWKC